MIDCNQISHGSGHSSFRRGRHNWSLALLMLRVFELIDPLSRLALAA